MATSSFQRYTLRSHCEIRSKHGFLFEFYPASNCREKLEVDPIMFPQNKSKTGMTIYNKNYLQSIKLDN